MSVDLSDLPREVIVKVGERQAISLPSYFGSGNSWSVRVVRGEDVARVWIELPETPDVAEPPDQGTTEPPDLMLVQESVIVLGLAAGKATCELTLARAFEATKPTATHELQVTVETAP
jgi:hypothetical protein